MQERPAGSVAPESPSAPGGVTARRLERSGIDPHRMALHRLGWPKSLLWHGYPPWVVPMLVGLALWALIVPIEALGFELPLFVRTAGSLVIGILILRTACDALITATERIAARKLWDHYVAGTLAEMLSTLPELVVICFVIPVSPAAAIVIALVTIYNNAFVFSIYSYFLPKDRRGRFVMPAAITEVGTQILIAGAGLGSVIGLVMLVFSSGELPKQAFSTVDLVFLATIMFGVFAVYLSVLIRRYASEEAAVRTALELSEKEVEARRSRVYDEVKRTSVGNIALLFAVGIGAAFVGGERVSDFAEAAIGELNLNPIAAAVVLAALAGMSEYVILWRAHRKGQHHIALANAFGGITQVMFLVLPFTLLAIGVYQGPIGAAHPELPLVFNHSMVMLFLLLFPTFFVLIELIEEDHTLGALDTTIMAAIFVLIIFILIAYGGA